MTRILACVLSACVLAVPAARADEESVPLDKVPMVIKDAVKKRFPKLEMTEAAKETDADKKTVYEVTVKDGKMKIDITLTSEGVITTIEKQIEVKDLPKAVSDAVEAKYPKATYKIAEEVITVKDGKETTAYYEALVETADKKTFELEVLADGKVKNVEEKKEEEKKEKKDK